MAVYIQRRGNVAVTQPCLDIFRVTPAFTQGIDRGMAQIVEADNRKADLLQPTLKVRGYIVWPHWSTVGVDADITAVNIGVTKQFLILCLLKLHLL